MHLQFIPVASVTKKYMTMTKQYFVNLDAIFGFTGKFKIECFVVKQIVKCAFLYRICTGLTEAAYHLLTAEVYAEWVCDKCLQAKNIPSVKFKP